MVGAASVLLHWCGKGAGIMSKRSALTARMRRGGVMVAAAAAVVPLGVFVLTGTAQAAAPTLASCGQTLAGCNLKGADLENADLAGANLQGDNLQSAVLTGADLASANLEGDNLQSAVLTGAGLAGANLQGDNLKGVSANGADFTDADLQGDNLQGGTFLGATFMNANLAGSNLKSANLTGADLGGADVQGANLQAIVWSNTICPDRTNSNGDGSTCVNDTTPAPPALLTITASSQTVTYGGTVQPVTPSYSGFVNGDTAASLTTPPTCTTTAASGSPAGAYTTTCSGAVDPNYTFVYVPGTVTVTPAPLTITASSASMSYGGIMPAITATYSGFVNGDTAAALTTQPTCATTATSGSPAGSYPTTCSAAVDANYAISYVNGTLTISSTAVLTVTASSQTVTYGGTVQAVTPSYSGFVNGDTAASLTTQPTCTTNAGPLVGSYTTSCSGAVDPNYTIVYVPGTVTIVPASLTITASSASITYGDAIPPINATYSGLVNGDTPGDFGTTCSAAATPTSSPGTYTTSCSHGSDPEYAISYVNGTLTVSAQSCGSSPCLLFYASAEPMGAEVGSAIGGGTAGWLGETTGPIEVVAYSSNGTVDTSYNGPVSVTLDSSSGFAGAVLGGTTIVDAVDGFASFAGLTVGTQGVYELDAFASGFGVGVSSTFDEISASSLVTVNNATTSAATATDPTTGQTADIEYTNNSGENEYLVIAYTPPSTSICDGTSGDAVVTGEYYASDGEPDVNEAAAVAAGPVSSPTFGYADTTPFYTCQ